MKPKCARRAVKKLRKRVGAGKNGVVGGWAFDFGWPDPTVNRKPELLLKAREKEARNDAD
jgi:hypothetical protein